MEGTLGGVMEKSLYDAAAMGDTKTVSDLLKSDPLLLDRVSFTSPNKTTPLHIATMYRRLAFVQAILKHNPYLAKELDYQQSTALHIASAEGYVEIVRELLEAAPNMCFSRNCQGKTPLHLAIVEGHGPVLEELVRVVPVAAKEKVDRGVGLLHLCVKHKQLEAMEILLVDFSEMINDRDDDGDIVLHMAVRDKEIEIVEYLLKMRNIDVNAKNSKGQTALESDIFKQNQNSQLREILKRAVLSKFNNFGEKERVENWRDPLMVVAILIATMAFQAAVSPPGGVWQNNSEGHLVGESTMDQYDNIVFQIFNWSNTVAFISSLSTILILISGLPFRRKVFTWILRVIIWLTIASIAMTYAISTFVVTPSTGMNLSVTPIGIAVIVWASVMVILVVGNTIRLFKIHWRSQNTVIKTWRSFINLVKVKHVTLGQAHV